jgi:hypothetical protein
MGMNRAVARNITAMQNKPRLMISWLKVRAMMPALMQAKPMRMGYILILWGVWG